MTKRRIANDLIIFTFCSFVSCFYATFAPLFIKRLYANPHDIHVTACGNERSGSAIVSAEPLPPCRQHSGSQILPPGQHRHRIYLAATDEVDHHGEDERVRGKD